MTTSEVAARFEELAREEKWFEIQDELFSDNVTSIEPPHSRWFPNAAGKAAVRKKGENFVSGIEEIRRTYTSPMIVTANHFAVGRDVDLTHREFGVINYHQIMLYEVRNGQIVSQHFFY